MNNNSNNQLRVIKVAMPNNIKETIITAISQVMGNF
jgi:hypothetical protein